MNKSDIRELTPLINNSEISSIQKVISEIIRVCNDPSSSAKDLKEVIEIDPPLTGKVLRRANSAYYARQRNVEEIQQAIILIGFDAVRDLALSQKVFEIFADETTIHGFSRIELWKQTLAAALMAKSIYRREFNERGENMYAAGILHNIGIIVEDQFLHDQFVQVLERKHTTPRELIDLEEKEFGFNHTNIGMAVANNWNLPIELVMAIGYHHSPELVPEDYFRSASTLFLADYLCQKAGIGFGHSSDQNGDRIKTILKKLNIKMKALNYIQSAVELEIHKMEKHDWFKTAA